MIAVDDGSTDASGDLLREWAARRPDRVRVITKENGGQSTARNAGLEHARGEWVTFTDPDDTLDPGYLQEVDTFLAKNPETPMVGTYRVFLDDATGELRDTHPLRMHFAGKSTLRYLDGWPSHFHGSAPAAFFRRARIEQLELRFDPEVRPNFEDGHFCVRYLLAEERPAVGFVKTAKYHYRKRSDASSTLQTSMTNPDRYTKVLRNGYLAVLRQSLEGRERPPEWLQNYIVYELSWYFTTQDAHAATGGSASGTVADEFHALMAEICPLIDEHVVLSFRLRHLRPSLRYVLSHGYADADWREDSVWVDRLDVRRGLARVRYHYTGRPPIERFLVRRRRGGARRGEAPRHQLSRADAAAREDRLGAGPQHGPAGPRRSAPGAAHRTSSAPALRPVRRHPPQGAEPSPPSPTRPSPAGSSTVGIRRSSSWRGPRRSASGSRTPGS